MHVSLHLNGIQAAVIDMDGVLWRGDTPLPGLAAFFALLRACDLPFVLATNNASKTPDTYVERLAGFGVSVRRSEILTSSLATAAYLAERYPEGAPVYAVGGPGLGAALAGAGFVLVDDASVEAALVVAGIDFGLTYDKLAHAALHIQRGARFVGTNGDLTYPAEAGRLPGAGTILAAIEAATGVRPEIVGKPERRMFDIAVARLGRPRDQTVMIGDRLETDILGGQRAGLKTILVTTGIDDAASAHAAGIEPDAVYSGLDTLTEAWRRALRDPR